MPQIGAMTFGRDCCVSSFLHRTGRAILTLSAVLLCVLGSARAGAAGPAVWQDPATGLALGGYDPLAYFTRGEPRAGSEDQELAWGGAVWRFLNTGNKAAFERHPHVYAPRFAGYDAYAIANGRTTPGHPAIWVNHKNRIYLFHNASNLQLWRENRDALVAQAEKIWPELSSGLTSSQGE